MHEVRVRGIFFQFQRESPRPDVWQGSRPEGPEGARSSDRPLHEAVQMKPGFQQRPQDTGDVGTVSDGTPGPR